MLCTRLLFPEIWLASLFQKPIRLLNTEIPCKVICEHLMIKLSMSCSLWGQNSDRPFLMAQHITGHLDFFCRHFVKTKFSPGYSRVGHCFQKLNWLLILRAHQIAGGFRLVADCRWLQVWLVCCFNSYGSQHVFWKFLAKVHFNLLR